MTTPDSSAQPTTQKSMPIADLIGYLLMGVILLGAFVALSFVEDTIAIVRSFVYTTLPAQFLGVPTYAHIGISDSAILAVMVSVMVGFLALGFVRLGSLNKGSRAKFLLAGVYLMVPCSIFFGVMMRPAPVLMPATGSSVLAALTYCDIHSGQCPAGNHPATEGAQSLARTIGASLAAKGCFMTDQVDHAIICQDKSMPQVSLAQYIIQNTDYIKAGLGECKETWPTPRASGLALVPSNEQGKDPFFVKVAQNRKFSCTSAKPFGAFKSTEVANTLRLMAR